MCRFHAVYIVNSIQKLSLHRAQGGRQRRCAVDRAVEGQTGVRKSLIILLQSFVLYTIFVNVTQNPAQTGQPAASHGVKPGINVEMSAGVPRNALYMGRRGLKGSVITHGLYPKTGTIEVRWCLVPTTYHPPDARCVSCDQCRPCHRRGHDEDTTVDNPCQPVLFSFFFKKKGTTLHKVRVLVP